MLARLYFEGLIESSQIESRASVADRLTKGVRNARARENENRTERGELTTYDQRTRAAPVFWRRILEFEAAESMRIPE